MPSAASPLALFGHFVRTMQPLDSPATFVPDLYLIGFSERPADCAGATGVSRFSRVESLCMHGVYDSAGSRRTRMFSRTRLVLPASRTPSAPWIGDFGAPYPAYIYPCPTLPVPSRPPSHDSGPQWF